MKVLITGGAGFIGRWLLRMLPDDIDVVVVDSLVKEVHGEDGRFPRDVSDRAVCVRSDLRDAPRWREAAADVDVVVHLAALTGTGQSMYQYGRYIDHNVLGTAVLCDELAAMERRPRRIILASSRAVYGEGAFRDGEEVVYPGPRKAEALLAGRWELESTVGAPLVPLAIREDAPLQPASVYGMTKMWQEQLVTLFAQTSGVDHVIFRFQNVYGPHQELSNPYTGILGVLAAGAMRRGKVELFEDGLMTRDFVYVADVARALTAGILHEGGLGRTLNVGSGQPVTVRDLTALLAGLGGTNPEVAIRGRYRVGDIRHSCADMSAYERVLGSWCPTPLRAGLGEYLAWLETQHLPPPETLDASLNEMATRQLLRVAR